MNLETLITSLSTDDFVKFDSFLKDKNRRTDVKNTALFKLIYSNTHSSEEIKEKLYPQKTKGAYHALRSRLFNSLIDFLASSTLEDENNERIQIIKLITVARLQLEKREFKLALKLLNKAEVIANEYQYYGYLNEIYHLKIEHSNNLESLELEYLITSFKKNQQQYFLEEEMNIVYAKIKKLLHQIRYEGKTTNFQELLSSTIESHNINYNDNLSFKSLYQLLTIASISASVTKDFLVIEPFMLETYQILEQRADKEKQTYFHIQVLFMIANTLFRNKKFEKSLHFLSLMQKLMISNRKKYYTRFLHKYELLKALNLNYTDNQSSAIANLELLLAKKHNDTESTLDIHLSLIVFYFQKNEFQNAYKLLKNLHHTDKYYTGKVGKEWIIKKGLIELLLLIELDYVDVFENKLFRFRRQHRKYLKENNLEKVLVFLKLVEDYYKNPKLIFSEKFLERIENSFEWVGAKREDIFEMSFYAWLKSKILQKPLYEVTLDFVEQAKKK